MNLKSFEILFFLVADENPTRGSHLSINLKTLAFLLYYTILLQGDLLEYLRNVSVLSRISDVILHGEFFGGAKKLHFDICSMIFLLTTLV